MIRGKITSSCVQYQRLLEMTIAKLTEEHAALIAHALERNVGICLQVAKAAEACAQELGLPAQRCSGSIWQNNQVILAKHHWLCIGEDVILDGNRADKVRIFRRSEHSCEYRQGPT